MNNNILIKACFTRIEERSVPSGKENEYGTITKQIPAITEFVCFRYESDIITDKLKEAYQQQLQRSRVTGYPTYAVTQFQSNRLIKDPQFPEHPQLINENIFQKLSNDRVQIFVISTDKYGNLMGILKYRENSMID